MNFALEVGQVTDTITVTEEAPVIQSETAELGTVINNRTVLEVPLNGREFYALLKLVPGTVSPAPNSGLAHRGGVSVAGARETSNAYTIDGIDNGSAGTNGPQIKIGVETLQEFKLLTNSYSPEYGRGGGGQVVMTTRSGTNEYRGTVWNFLRNDWLDAKNFFDSRPKPPPLRRNQFGFVFGGPVGSLENLHFFTGFEGLRNRKSLTSGATVPNAAWHDGDFSSLLPGRVIRDPLTSDPFPGNIIPQDRWDPIGKEFVEFYPDPTNSNRSRNLITNPSQDRDNDQATLRLDYSFGAHNIYARHIYNRELIAEAFQGRGGGKRRARLRLVQHAGRQHVQCRRHVHLFTVPDRDRPIRRHHDVGTGHQQESGTQWQPIRSGRSQCDPRRKAKVGSEGSCKSDHEFRLPGSTGSAIGPHQAAGRNTSTSSTTLNGT